MPPIGLEAALERAPGIRPYPRFWRALDVAARRAFPGASTLAMILILLFPWHANGQAELQAACALTSVYFWSIYRPNSMKPLVVFAIGLFCDLVGPGPLGVDMLVLLGVHGVALRNRVWLIRQGFLPVWLGFGMVAVCGCLVQWSLTSALDLRLFSPVPAFLECGLATGLYPLFAIMLTRAHSGMAAPELA